MAAMFKALTAALLAFALSGVAPAVADDYPSHPIRVIVPLTPGTTIDILARLFADRLAAKFHQSVIVVNRAGAGGLVAAESVASAPADGYTLLFANSGHAILGTLNKNLPFDPVADFKGIGEVAEAPAVVTVSPATGANTLKEFVALAKAKPGKLSFGSAGIGTATHLSGAYFDLVAGIDMLHVPYKDSTQLLTDVAAGRVDAVFAPAAYSMAMVKAGKVKALAIGSDEPMTEPLQIPTAKSQDVDYLYTTWYGFLGPAKVPEPILKKLSDAIGEIGQEPAIKAAIARQAITPHYLGLGEFDASIKRDMTRLAPLLKTISRQAGK